MSEVTKETPTQTLSTSHSSETLKPIVKPPIKRKSKRKNVKRRTTRSQAPGSEPEIKLPENDKERSSVSVSIISTNSTVKPRVNTKPLADRKAETTGNIDKNDVIAQKLDRFGFINSINESLDPVEAKLRNKERIKETEREIKWLEMFKQWPLYTTRKRAKLEERVMKGIPDSLRSRAWQLIIDPDSIADRPPVSSFIEKGSNEWLEIIERDLRRTMPSVAMFSQKNILDSLRNVLHAYSNADEELGYTQGMAFIAAMLLFYMDEASAFWCFHTLMRSDRYSFRLYYTEQFPKLKSVSDVWEHLFATRYKKIHAHFNDVGIFPLSYINWFLSAFMDIGFTPVLKLQIFDRYVTFGTRALLSFGLVIISRHKKLFLKGGLEDILPVLKRPEESPDMKDWRYVIKKWDELWLSQDAYASAFKATNIPIFF